MSTRGAIAKLHGDGWTGVYNHSDSYPTWLAEHVWDDLYDTYGGDVERFCHERIDAVPQGYSSFPSLPYGSDEEPMPVENDAERDPESTAPLFIEWVYVLAMKTMTILVNVQRDGPRNPMTGAPPYGWELVAQVKLNGIRPDWVDIEQRGRSIRAARQMTLDYPLVKPDAWTRGEPPPSTSDP